MLATARDDPGALEAILAEDVVWEVGALHPLGASGTYDGPSGVLTFFRHWVGAFDDWGYRFDEMSAMGDAVVVHIHQWGTGRGSGARVEQDFWQVWKIRDGMVIRGSNHAFREDALTAARS